MEFPPLGPAEVSCDRYRVAIDDTGPRLPHTSYVFGNKEKLLFWAYCWLFERCDGVPLDHSWVGFPPLGPTEVDWDRNRVVGGDIGPRVPHTSHVFGNKEKLC